MAATGTVASFARHPRPTPGSPRIAEEHCPDAPRGERTPKPTTPAEAQFLAIGPGAAAWLIEAAATGVRRIRAKIANAVALAKLYGSADVDRALGTAGRSAASPREICCRSWASRASTMRLLANRATLLGAGLVESAGRDCRSSGQCSFVVGAEAERASAEVVVLSSGSDGCPDD